MSTGNVQDVVRIVTSYTLDYCCQFKLWILTGYALLPLHITFGMYCTSYHHLIQKSTMSSSAIISDYLFYGSAAKLDLALLANSVIFTFWLENAVK